MASSNGLFVLPDLNTSRALAPETAAATCMPPARKVRCFQRQQKQPPNYRATMSQVSGQGFEIVAGLMI